MPVPLQTLGHPALPTPAAPAGEMAQRRGAPQQPLGLQLPEIRASVWPRMGVGLRTWHISESRSPWGWKGAG